MPRSVTPVITLELAEQCRSMVHEAAVAYNVPPVYVTAHIPHPRAYKARLEVQSRMIEELGLRRHQVASIFNRDLRRVRASVLAKAPRRNWRVAKNGQFVWDFVEQPEAKRTTPSVKAFIRPIPKEVAESLDPREKKTLIAFYRQQARELAGG